MDQIPVQEYPNAGRPIFKIFAFVFVFLIIALLAFNLYVNRFGKFWERKAANPKTGMVAQPKLRLTCPVPQEFCSQGKVINEEGFSGVVYTLPLGTSVSAAFSGKLSDEPKLSERSPSQPLLYLRTPQGYEAIYSFYGSTFGKPGKEISTRDVIGQIGKGNFPTIVSFGGSNFLFSLKKDGKFVPLSLEDFEK